MGLSLTRHVSKRASSGKFIFLAYTHYLGEGADELKLVLEQTVRRVLVVEVRVDHVVEVAHHRLRADRDEAHV